MAIPRKIKQYLFHNAVPYTRKMNTPGATAQGVTAASPVFGGEFAETVVLRADDRLIMAALPGDRAINTEKMKRALGCLRVALATEKEFSPEFEQCDRAAIPPFGRLFGLPLYCDETLANSPEIEFQAGNQTDTVCMKYSDLAGLEKPIVLDCSDRAPESSVRRNG